ncbi:hypothetical protein [Nocardioides terrisoli]|uniref:hypothetical protein n=1 Tax=Nocardioides terrisoli TaxID=3388267 RepID=UPI00287BA4D8|nr:hypothetical protein [Nocardioides marmorisolisilvae]
MNIEQPFQGMTWGDLRAFVALSDAADAEEIVYDCDDQLERVSMLITGIDLKRVTHGP